MPDELKNCPFCGGNAGYCGDKEITSYVWCENPHCKMHNRYEFTASYWNSRPIEDDLHAENAKLKARVAAAEADDAYYAALNKWEALK